MKKPNVTIFLISTFILAALNPSITGVFGQRVKVQPEVKSYPGQTVNLQCQYVSQEGTALTQVSWIWEPTEGKRDNIAVYHPNFGPSYPESPLKGRVTFMNASLLNPSITIQDVKMTDEGRYICEYATYPSGNEQGATTLIMLAKPVNSGSAVTAVAGTTPAVVARCESANGRPPASITWVTVVSGNDTKTTKPGTGNTVTVTSEYKLVPTATDNGKEISCVITHLTQSTPEVMKMNLVIEYPPEVKIVGYDENWYMGRSTASLTCQVAGNPSPNIEWKTTSGPLPQTVQAKGPMLTVAKVDDTVNTTFVCEATNHRGRARHQLMVMVRDTQLPVPGPATGAIIGGIIACIILLVLISVAVMMFLKHHRNEDAPPKYKPPPPVKTGSSVEKPNAEQASETQPLGETFYGSSEPVTNLDDADYQKNGHSEDCTLSGLEDSSQAHYQGMNHQYISEPKSHYPASHDGSFVSKPMLV